MSDKDAWKYDWSMVVKDLSDVAKDFDTGVIE